MLDLLYTFNSSSVYLHCISHHTTDQHICYTDLFKIRKRKKKQLYIWNILYLVQHTVSLHFSSLFLKLLWRFICQSFLLKCILFKQGPFWNLTTAMFHTGWSHGRFILKYHTSFVYLCCSIHVSWYMVFNATFNNISVISWWVRFIKKCVLTNICWMVLCLALDTFQLIRFSSFEPLHHRFVVHTVSFRKNLLSKQVNKLNV